MDASSGGTAFALLNSDMMPMALFHTADAARDSLVLRYADYDVLGVPPVHTVEHGRHSIKVSVATFGHGTRCYHIVEMVVHAAAVKL